MHCHVSLIIAVKTCLQCDRLTHPSINKVISVLLKADKSAALVFCEQWLQHYGYNANPKTINCKHIWKTLSDEKNIKPYNCDEKCVLLYSPDRHCVITEAAPPFGGRNCTVTYGEIRKNAERLLCSWLTEAFTLTFETLINMNIDCQCGKSLNYVVTDTID